MLKIFNSLTRSKETVKPIVAGQLGLYVCGMTVYDYCHLGHARVMVAFDVIVRYLRQQGYLVNYVRNITDIDDKIIARAAERGVTLEALTATYIAAMREDEQALGIVAPDHTPQATAHVGDIIALIQTLVGNGHAYVTTSGDVCYHVERFPRYGALAHKDLAGLRAGARVAVVSDKQDPLDFVLWKLAKPGEPSWPSPWGLGRPGWHIECSAMSMQCLGAHFDIHGGGADLQFPHHENEIAQSEAASGKTFVNTWMHVGFVQVDKEKMSKSLGNFFTIREVLAKHPAEVVRYVLVASHYRSPLQYSEQALQHAKEALARFYLSLRDLPAVPVDEVIAAEYKQRFYAAMDDDFNTPEALAVLFDLAREINRVREGDRAQAAQLAAILRALACILGLLQQDANAFLRSGTPQLTDAAIDALLIQRQQARVARDWQAADQIRDQLHAAGIVLEDNPTGTLWRRE